LSVLELRDREGPALAIVRAEQRAAVSEVARRPKIRSSGEFCTSGAKSWDIRLPKSLWNETRR
jgi:hypothetical protein